MATPEEVFEEVSAEPVSSAAGGSSAGGSSAGGSSAAAPPSPAKPGPSGVEKFAPASKKAPEKIEGDTYYVIRPEGYNGEQSFTIKQCCGNELKIVIKPEHYSEVEWLANKKQRELNHLHGSCATMTKEKQVIKEKIKVSGNQISDAKERLRDLKIQLLLKLARLATWQRKKEVEKEIRPDCTAPKEGHLSLEKKLRDLEKQYREQSDKVLGLRDDIRFTIEESVLLESHAEDLKIENRRIRDQTRNNQIVLESLKHQNAELETKCKQYMERYNAAQAQAEELDETAEALARENQSIVQENQQLATAAQPKKKARSPATSPAASPRVSKKSDAKVAPGSVRRPTNAQPSPLTSRATRPTQSSQSKATAKPARPATATGARGAAKPSGPRGAAAGARARPATAKPATPGAPSASAARAKNRKVSVAQAAATVPTEAEIQARMEYLERNADSLKQMAKDGADHMKQLRDAADKAGKSGMKKGAAKPQVSKTKSDLMRRLQALRDKQNK